MRDGQYRLLWTGISNSKKMRAVQGERWFRLGCHLVYTWLLPWCDDDGRMPGEPLKILANVVPNESLTIGEIEKILAELHRVGLIFWYEVENEKFIQIYDWEKYQRIRKDRYKSSAYPIWQPIDNQTSTNCPQNCDLSPSPSPSPSPSKKHKCPEFSHDSVQWRMANWFHDTIQKLFPKTKPKTERELQKEAYQIDLMMRMDGRQENDIASLVKWIRRDDCWWRSRILTIKNLRKNFDTIQAQMGGL